MLITKSLKLLIQITDMKEFLTKVTNEKKGHISNIKNKETYRI